MTDNEKRSILNTQARLLKLEEEIETLKREKAEEIAYFQQEIGYLERAHDSFNSHNGELERVKDGE